MPTPAQTQDAQEMERIVAEEQRVLSRVLKHLATRQVRRTGRIDYDTELVTLRDQIAEARLEDVPALVAEMERLQQVAARRADVLAGDVDVGSPYFGRIVLQEGERKREVLIGRATYLDPRTGVQIVDWRDAPVSRIYYRYGEGDDYDEEFGDRVVEGEVLTRRSLAISGGRLRRIAASQGTFLRRGDDAWVKLADDLHLEGGQGTAPRPSDYAPVGKLGIGLDGEGREDKHLPEIAALIDRRQFELITKPDSGLVVIQGGAGSGKTTIGLHRLAFLAYRDPQRFQPDRMIVVVFNDALARYIAHVLPALGVDGVPVTTFHAWARKLRAHHLPALASAYTDETPDVVARLKKHPAWLRIIDAWAAAEEAAFSERLRKACVGDGDGVMATWVGGEGRALTPRAEELQAWASAPERGLSPAARHAIDREVAALVERCDVVALWSELLTDRAALAAAFARHAPGDFTDGQLDTVVRWCSRRIGAVLDEMEAREEREEREEAGIAESEVLDFEMGVDGAEERQPATLDWEDDALLLRLYQRLRGPLRRGKDALRYEHSFVDETQDLSPLELAVVLDSVRSRSVTLAGDVAQRLLMDNGFSDWKKVLDDLGLAHVAVEPLRISYRSTQEIIDFAQEVLGSAATEPPGKALRHGVPVELFRFSGAGEAVAYLSEQLRALASAEPLASVAVITRTPEQARQYAEGLTHAEVPNARFIAEQDFPFRPGIDVTDVRQVKGLEFDYVVLVEVTATSYPDDDEARHLLHIAATRAAHQLWVATGDAPSPLLPARLIERGY
jgi:DNA helicase-2/ATP-dependent DNA helicase PcrA